MTKADLPIMLTALPDDWVARCAVCDTKFAIRAVHQETQPNSCFCPDCQVNRLVAPGVLSWKRRHDLETKLTQGCYDSTPMNPVA